jgi:hypothetical protein
MKHQPNRFYHLVMFMGSADGVFDLVKELQQVAPDGLELAEAEVTAHLAWFEREIRCTCNIHVGDHICRGWKWETAPADAASEVPPTCIPIAALKERVGSRGITMYYIAIDSQLAPHAVSVAFCSNCNASEVGSIGGKRQNYLRVLKHLFYGDDSAALLTDLSTNQAIGPIPYRHRQQWSESVSPLRIDFRSEDPARMDLGLSFNRGSGSPEDFIVRGGVVPPDGNSINVHTDWRTAYMILRRAPASRVDVYFDAEAQFMVSGYGLFQERLIDSRLKLVSSSQDPSFADVSEDQARICVMQLYGTSLASFLNSPIDSQTEALARDHFLGAFAWLGENGGTELSAA